MKKIFNILLLITILFCLPNKTMSQVEVIADGRLQTILEKHVQYNQLAKTTKGYRIRVATYTSEGAKEQAFKLKQELLNAFPEQRTYVVFDEPNFIVKIGDYPTRLDAMTTYMQLKPLIATSLIIQDYINSPTINEDELQNLEYFEDDMEQ